MLKLDGSWLGWRKRHFKMDFCFSNLRIQEVTEQHFIKRGTVDEKRYEAGRCEYILFNEEYNRF